MINNAAPLFNWLSPTAGTFTPVDKSLALALGALVPAGGHKIGTKVAERMTLQTLLGAGLSEKVAKSVIGRGALRSELKIAKGSSDTAHHIIPVQELMCSTKLFKMLLMLVRLYYSLSA